MSPLRLRRAFLVLVLTVLGCGGGEPRVVRDVAYDARGGADTTYDVYLPPGEATGRPAVLLVHGGSWKFGNKERYVDIARRLAASGWVAVSVNYRLVPQVRWPIAAQDVRCALAHVRAHAADLGVDPRRVAVAGYSAGGHLASLLGVANDIPEVQSACDAGDTPPPDAVVSGAGVQDLRELGWTLEVQNFLGGTLDVVPDVYARASPLDHVGAGAPPFLLLHGDQDLYVPVGQSVRMRDALLAAGNHAELLVLPGGGHVLNPSAGTGELAWKYDALETPEAFWAMTDFLTRTLGAP